MTARTQRLKQRLLDSPFEICVERALLWTESQKQTQGMPQVIRNALALKNVLAKMSVAIREDELIVGSRTSKLRGSPLFPETKSLSIEAQLDAYDSRPVQPFAISEADKRALRKILPCWRGKSAWDRAFELMPPELQLEVHKFNFTVEAEFANGIGHFIVGNPNLLKKGFALIGQDAAHKLAATPEAGPEQKAFWEAVVITSDAAIAFARRYSALARGLAGSEPDPERKAELLGIAEACERAPEYQPRNFREAVQAVWFNQLICQIECGGFAISPGRLDQLLYPFYRRDLAEVKISPDRAQELIECLYVKMSEVVNALDTILLPVTSGPPIAQSLTVGGTDPNGNDATNELSHLFVAALDSIRTVWPNLAVRFHPGTPAEFTGRVCQAVAGGTMMALFNDEVIVPSLLASGISKQEAYDYAIVGCVEPSTSGGTFASTDSNLVNVARCLEMALNDGDGMDLLADRKHLARLLSGSSRSQKQPAARRSAWQQYKMLLKYLLAMAGRTDFSRLKFYHGLRGKNLGVKSGDAPSFDSIEAVLAAFEKQVAHAVEKMAQAMHYCDRAHAELKPTPFISSCIDDCIERGADVTWGGARYNFTGPQAVGLADVADSLAAVKTLVFGRKKISMAELLAAVRGNFRNAEPLRRMLISKAPKFGNGDPEVDELARKAAEIYCRQVSRHKNFRAGAFRPGIYSMSGHIVFGALTGALPSGRGAGEPLAAGLSPCRGRETRGPTAVMSSVASVDGTKVSNGYVLNMSFHPHLLAGEDALRKFADLLRAYFKLGGLHVQYNVIDAESLREAQQFPEKWPGLVVRVAGYSALWSELDRATQNDIICRTMHGVV